MDIEILKALANNMWENHMAHLKSNQILLQELQEKVLVRQEYLKNIVGNAGDISRYLKKTGQYTPTNEHPYFVKMELAQTNMVQLVSGYAIELRHTEFLYVKEGECYNIVAGVRCLTDRDREKWDNRFLCPDSRAASPSRLLDIVKSYEEAATKIEKNLHIFIGAMVEYYNYLECLIEKAEKTNEVAEAIIMQIAKGTANPPKHTRLRIVEEEN